MKKKKNSYLQVVKTGDEIAIQLQGKWAIYNAAAIQKEIEAYAEKRSALPVKIDLSQIEDIDTTGVWLIKKYFNCAALQGASEQQMFLLSFLPDELKELPRKPSPWAIAELFIAVGKETLSIAKFSYEVMVFTGKISIRFITNFSRSRHFRFPSLARHIHESGIQAIPIIALLGLSMSMVISYQAFVQLQKFGASIYTIDLGVISILREMGVLITAVMVAGRSGSAFAAEIGVMKIREEIDALRTMGIDPIEVLVLPRLLAMIIALPFLTLIADLVGLAGGSIMSLALLDVSVQQYFERAEKVATYNMFFVGMIKAPVFAFLIAIIGTYQGMNVSGSAENVGRLTTVAVVQSIFLVIVADAIFSLIFSKVGI